MSKKRIVSLVLTVAMLVALFPCGVSAATTKTVGGTEYIVVSTAKQLYDVLERGGNILLKNDIALNSYFEDTVTVKPGTVLDGNGHTITYKSTRTTPLFRYAAGTAIEGTKVGEETIYIKNLNFGNREIPMTLSKANSLFTEQAEDACRVIYQNVDFFIRGENLTGARVGGLYSILKGVASFYGCTLNVNLSSSVEGNLVGGWVGEIYNGDLVMTDCTTFGSITGSGLCTGAYVGQANRGNSRYTNCVNYADVTGVGMTAGFVGNVGTSASSLYCTNCINYGTVTSTGSGYDGSAGGIMARSSNVGDQGNQRLRVFYNCVNYGKITAGNRAGGIVGTSHDYDTNGQDANYAYYTYDECINYGDVSGKVYAGGIMGIASPATYRAEITDCINVGKINSKNGYAGNFAGMLCGGVITGGYAAGVITTKRGTDVLVPCVSGKYVMQEGKFEGEAWAISAPTVSNVHYIGKETALPEGITKVADENLSAALADMAELCGFSFVAADASDETAYVVLAEPELRGVQQSVKVTDGCVDLRLAAAVNALDAYESLGITVKLHVGGKVTEANYETRVAYKALNAASDGGASSVSAESLACQYLYTITLADIPLDGEVLIEAKPYATAKDGTKYTGKASVIAACNGVYKTEPMLLNGALLQDYAIVYASSDKLCEELLAERLSDEIAKLTGIEIPVYADTESCPNTAKLLIGRTAETTAAVSRRTIRTQGTSKVIVISGIDSSQLSESIEYFIESMEKKMLERNSVWSFSVVSVPVDNEVTMMAYNMGAKNNAYIKEAEWELIVDYLPDIWTAQEPWAGFLDDFLNDYAVKPAVKFEEDPEDDDVMKSDVNNKCFTGDGYYGVYWGLPRWVPGDPCTAGKASYSVILYAKDRFTVDETRSGTFWLSAEVDKSGTNFTGSDFARCATYATLTDKNTGKTFTVVNVHLDFVEEVQIAQISILLSELKTRVGEDMQIIVMGDMNSRAHSAPIKLYKENEVMPMASFDELADRAYRRYYNIDWFFTNHPEQLEVMYYNNCFEQTFLNQLWNASLVVGMPSDHPAIYTEFKFR